MFKNILYLSIIASFSLSSQAESLDELANLYGENEQSLSKDVSLEDLDSLFSDADADADEKLEVNSTKNKDLLFGMNLVEVNPKEELESYKTTEELLETVFRESNGASFSQSSGSADFQFLKYVPEESSIVFNKTLYIPRTKDTFIYSYGKPVLNVDKENFSVCYVKFSKSNKPRELMEGRTFLINKNITKKAITSNNNKTVFFSTLGIDNPNINYVKCLTNEKETPLTIDDFEAHFGGAINIKFPDYEKI
jgi:hypothetical protein